MAVRLSHYLTMIFLLLSFSLSAQGNLDWTPATTGVYDPDGKLAYGLRLDPLSLSELLGSEAYVNGNPRVRLPLPDGSVRELRLKPVATLHPDLQSRFPAIRSFTATDPVSGVRVRLSISHRDVQATYRMKDGSLRFLQPQDRKRASYRLYAAESSSRKGLECLTRDDKELGESVSNAARTANANLRTFRIAISTTGEYTLYHGGTVADALSAINASITRINEVFSVDLGVQLQLVASNDAVVFTNAETDPYENNNFISQSQLTIDDRIGAANYDLGHVFHRASAQGQAGGIGTVCRDNIKGSGYSASNTPEGDLFDIDFVAHELGHQFGANHTFSFRPEGTQVQVEPASGTTIMTYAGITSGNDNVQGQVDDYFHLVSIVQIQDYLSTVGCGTIETFANTPPVVSPLNSHTIPRGTAFVLEAEATDAEEDALTYCWEQIDNGVITSETFGPNNSAGANFRSLPPVTENLRYFPRLSRVRTGSLTQADPVTNAAWETVSNVARTMNFSVAVRDNNPQVGLTGFETVEIVVTDQAGPFVFENLSTPGVWTAGDPIELRWDVAGTTAAPISAATVSVYASADGGLSFPHVIREGLDNTGSAWIQVPALETDALRFMVRPDGQIFFAMNLADQTVTVDEFTVELDQLASSACQDETLTIPFSYTDFTGSLPTVSFSANAPTGINAVVSPTSSTASTASGTLVITADPTVPAGTYELTLLADNGSRTQSTPVQLTIGDPLMEGPVLTAPADGGELEETAVSLSWQEVPGATGYGVEVATDAGFSQLAVSVDLLGSGLTLSSLPAGQTYYWRVRSSNACGTSPYSVVRTFTLPVVNCFDYSSGSTPVALPSTGANTSTAEIQISEDFRIEDLNISIDLTHTWVADLEIFLISPAGTRVSLIDQICGDANDINAVFDDQGQGVSCGNNPALSGVILPAESLSAFNGERSQGTWTLVIDDFFDQDGGTLNGFSLQLCLLGNLANDDDNDGVDNDNDLCPGTPNGQEVDSSGCPVFALPENAFSIQLNSESCRGSSDGSIGISPSNTQLAYTAELDGPGVNETRGFSRSTSFDGLGAGTYDLCITASDGVNAYQAVCYELVLTEPEPLSVLTQQSLDGTRLSVNLSGSSFYTLSLNGDELLVTENVRDFPLKPGLNVLEVKGDLDCKGVYRETFINGASVFVAPNPVDDLLQVFFPNRFTRLRLQIYDTSGRLVDEELLELTDEQNLIRPAGRLNPGLYYLRITSGGFTATTKFIKR